MIMLCNHKRNALVVILDVIILYQLVGRHILSCNNAWQDTYCHVHPLRFRFEQRVAIFVFLRRTIRVHIPRIGKVVQTKTYGIHAWF